VADVVTALARQRVVSRRGIAWRRFSRKFRVPDAAPRRRRQHCQRRQRHDVARRRGRRVDRRGVGDGLGRL